MKTETPDQTPPITQQEIDQEMEGFQRHLDDRTITRKELDKEMEDFRRNIFGCLSGLIAKAAGSRYQLVFNQDGEPLLLTQREYYEWRERRERASEEAK